MLLDLAARFNLRAPCECIEAVSFGRWDAGAALSHSSIGKASVSVTVGVIVIGDLAMSSRSVMMLAAS